ncbi:hypothetical protein FHX09_005887 [Rhizobium sp. BK538]|nr:hypothetical protein [Rhizobium sp. BK060]MBB4171989.1 hypothetical protein [Rhizobium sp. BK538]TCM62831.1 hypothetical protein EV291_1515 [Rhizobium sp. BK068]
MHAQDCYRWLRWFVLDHALLLFLIAIMIATMFSVLLYRASGDVGQRGFDLQRSIRDHL